MTPVIVKDSALQQAASEGMDAFIRVFTEGIHNAIGGELTAENMPELNACRKLTPEQVTNFRSAMGKCFYWKITLDEDRKQRENKQETQAFGLNYELKDNKTFAVSLRGRMDTITAPELLKVWEAAKADHEISAVEIDCFGMQYISSAGLRVFLMMYKALDDKGKFKLTGVNDTVREILETTGFDQFLL